MKYFTKEELEDITNKIIENPTRETLQNLNDTYNGSSMQQELVNDNVVDAVPVATSLSNVSVPIQNEVVNDVLPSSNLNEQVNSPVSTPVEIPGINNNIEVPNIELPKLETPVFNNQNNEPINFSGNLFEQPMSNIGNLMQTTDNFNAVPSAIPNTEVSVAPGPFFGVNNEPVNNPIPVEGPVNNMQSMGPSMFGQMQQNYM